MEGWRDGEMRDERKKGGGMERCRDERWKGEGKER